MASSNQNVLQSSFVRDWLNLATEFLPEKDVSSFVASFWKEKATHPMNVPPENVHVHQ